MKNSTWLLSHLEFREPVVPVAYQPVDAARSRRWSISKRRIRLNPFDPYERYRRPRAALADSV